MINSKHIIIASWVELKKSQNSMVYIFGKKIYKLHSSVTESNYQDNVYEQLETYDVCYAMLSKLTKLALAFDWHIMPSKSNCGQSTARVSWSSLRR
jgi:hypothetical protein